MPLRSCKTQNVCHSLRVNATRIAHDLRQSRRLPELVHFPATDRILLPGLLYEPRRPTNAIVLWLHGNGDSSVFYSERTNLLGSELVRRGIAFFPFDNRGAGLVKHFNRLASARKRSMVRGMTHERIRESVRDIEGAIAFARSRGYTDITLAGHSSGANKAVLYGSVKPRAQVKRFALVAGGDDSGIYFRQLGERRFFTTLARCREKIAAGKGAEFAPPSLSPFLISWRSLYDTMNPDGDYNIFPFREAVEGRISRKPLFRHLKKLKKPALFVYGSEDEFCIPDVGTCIELLREVAPRASFVTIDGAGHGFRGRELDLGATMAQWILQQRGGSLR